MEIDRLRKEAFDLACKVDNKAVQLDRVNVALKRKIKTTEVMNEWLQDIHMPSHQVEVGGHKSIFAYTKEECEIYLNRLKSKMDNLKNTCNNSIDRRSQVKKRAA